MPKLANIAGSVGCDSCFHGGQTYVQVCHDGEGVTSRPNVFLSEPERAWWARAAGAHNPLELEQLRRRGKAPVGPGASLPVTWGLLLLFSLPIYTGRAWAGLEWCLLDSSHGLG